MNIVRLPQGKYNVFRRYVIDLRVSVRYYAQSTRHKKATIIRKYETVASANMYIIHLEHQNTQTKGFSSTDRFLEKISSFRSNASTIPACFHPFWMIFGRQLSSSKLWINHWACCGLTAVSRKSIFRPSTPFWICSLNYTSVKLKMVLFSILHCMVLLSEIVHISEK